MCETLGKSGSIWSVRADNVRIINRQGNGALLCIVTYLDEAISR